MQKPYLKPFHLLANLHDGENCNNVQIDSLGQIFIKFDGGGTVENNTDIFNQLPERKENQRLIQDHL